MSADSMKDRFKSLEVVFKDFLHRSNQFDSEAASLVEPMLWLAAWSWDMSAGYQGQWQILMSKAQAALDLLASVPRQGGPGASHLSDFPLTRRALWRHVVVGFVTAADETSRARFAEALMFPGILSPAERHQLKECLDQDLGLYAKQDPLTRRKIRVALKHYSAEGNDLALEVFIKLLSQWGSIEEKRALLVT